MTSKPICFIDFEASSLAEDSYPIELGWAVVGGESGAFLIRPAPDWTDWSPISAGIHGISRGELDANGIPASEGAERLAQLARWYALASDAPVYEAHWAERLLAKEAGHRAPQMTTITIFDANEIASSVTQRLLKLPTWVWRRGGLADARAALLKVRLDAMRSFEGVRHRGQADAERLRHGHQALFDATDQVMLAYADGITDGMGIWFADKTTEAEPRR